MKMSRLSACSAHWYALFLKAIGVACIGLISAASQSAIADPAKLFQDECSQCHSLEANEAVRVGPALASIVGKPAGRVENFSYSQALQAAAAGGLLWDAASLDKFLESPGTFISGTRMTYAGLADDADRQMLIEWLASAVQSDVDGLESAVSPDVERIAALDADIDYGEYLASECLTCHVEGGSDGIPPIKGLSKNYFIEALLAYKSGEKTNQVMQLMAGGMGDDEMAALAKFFTEAQ